MMIRITQRRKISLVTLLFIILSIHGTVEAIRLTPTRRQFFVWPQVTGRQKRRASSSTYRATLPEHPEDHLVTHLPNISFTTTSQQWAGHLPVSNDGTRFFFYWLVAPDEVHDDTDDTIPLILWLNGGPGCSSMNGVFIENGPFRFAKDDGTIISNPYSWHRLPAYMLYLDQPVGTGLSYKTNDNTYATSDEQLQADFYAFLQSFFTLHKDRFVTDTSVRRKVYLSGESYAGRYIPLFITHILQQNKLQQQQQFIQIPIQGAAVGNGWIDPYHQYAGAKAAYGMGLVGMAEVYAELKSERQCQESLPKASTLCDNMIPNIVHQSMGTDSDYKVSKFDVRRVEHKTGPRTFPPGKHAMEAYLRNDAVLQALHAHEAAAAASLPFAECQPEPLDQLGHLDGYGVMPEIQSMLDNHVKLLFYNGVMDMVCHHVGTETALDQMPWEHQDAWKMADRYAFLIDDDNSHVAGFMKQYRNLFFLKVLHAGHMVPLDVPDVAFFMMKTFVYGLEFRISTQRQDFERSMARSCLCCGWMTSHRYVKAIGSAVLLMALLIGLCGWLVLRRTARSGIQYGGLERTENVDAVLQD